MERDRERLSRARLCVISAEPDHELDRIARRIAPAVRIGGRAELEGLFERLLAAGDGAGTIAPKTLDVLGHSTAGASLVRLGDWILDGDDPAVLAWARSLAERRVLPRLGIHAVRLLACQTAGTARGCATICALSDALGVEVHGTTHLLHEAHYDAAGFRDTWAFLLVSARELRRDALWPTVIPDAARGPRTLDLGALPAHPLGPSVGTWPRHVATASTAHRILQLVRRDAGAPMPALVAPSYELALPAARPGEYHIAHVLFGGGFIRFFPDGAAGPGVVYPVDDAPALRRIVDALAPPAVSP